MNEKYVSILINILRILIAAPIAYCLGEYLQWKRFMLIALYFGVYMVVSLLIEMIRQAIWRS